MKQSMNVDAEYPSAPVRWNILLEGSTRFSQATSGMKDSAEKAKILEAPCCEVLPRLLREGSVPAET